VVGPLKTGGPQFHRFPPTIRFDLRVLVTAVFRVIRTGHRLFIWVDTS